MILKKVPVVVIEDLISTGKSSLNAVEALQKNNIDVLGVFAIFSYGLEVAKINFEKANQKFYSLSDFSTLVDCSKKHIGFSQDDLEIHRSNMEKIFKGVCNRLYQSYS